MHRGDVVADVVTAALRIIERFDALAMARFRDVAECPVTGKLQNRVVWPVVADRRRFGTSGRSPPVNLGETGHPKRE